MGHIGRRVVSVVSVDIGGSVLLFVDVGLVSVVVKSAVEMGVARS